VTDIRCGYCQDHIACGTIVGMGIRYPRNHQARGLPCEYLLGIRCRQCGVLSNLPVPATHDKWRACHEWLVTRGRPVVMPEGTEGELDNALDGNTRHSLDPKRSKSKVQPSVLAGTPVSPISWSEQRAFVRQMSLCRNTKKFERWMERLQNKRPKPPGYLPPPF
jgi:hypothetical protein